VDGQLPLVVDGEGKELETDAKLVENDQIYAPFIGAPTGRSSNSFQIYYPEIPL
jgi:hypothetical protein